MVATPFSATVIITITETGAHLGISGAELSTLRLEIPVADLAGHRWRMCTAYQKFVALPYPEAGFIKIYSSMQIHNKKVF